MHNIRFFPFKKSYNPYYRSFSDFFTNIERISSKFQLSVYKVQKICYNIFATQTE